MMQTEVEYLTSLQMTFSLGILSLTRDSHLFTFESGNAKTQIDFILLRNRNLKMVKIIKVIPSEGCVPQHKILTCELRLKTPKSHSTPFSLKLRYCKLKEQTIRKEFKWIVKSKVAN